MLQRTMNGLLNRLSDQSKDAITRSMRNLFEANSLNVSNNILKSCMLSVCAKSDQTMVTLIPVYAAVISVLHTTVSKEIGAFMVENLVLLLISELDNIASLVCSSSPSSSSSSSADRNIQSKSETDTPAAPHALIGNKRLVNYLLILLYLYNLKVLHHQLIIDLMKRLCHMSPPTATAATSASSSSSSGSGLSELELEMVVCIVEHCGHLLRRDDPSAFKIIVTTLSTTLTATSTSTTDTTTTAAADDIHTDIHSNQLLLSQATESRSNYFIEVLRQANQSGKSSRILNKYQDNCSVLRKWVGTMRSSIIHTNSAAGGRSTSTSRHGQVFTIDTCLCVSLQDILDVELRGRWWRAGASWQQKQQPMSQQSKTTKSHSLTQSSQHDNSNNDNNDEFHDDEDNIINGYGQSQKKEPVTSKKTVISAEEEQLLQLAKKMKFNTATRKNIFLVIMTSVDVNDAYERLLRLDFKGKEDREIIRVSE